MCCRVKAHAFDRLIAETILTLGQFKKQDGGSWVREVPEENISVHAAIDSDGLRVYLNPSIHQWEQHHEKRMAAGIMFEIAARYAEKTGAELTQDGINIPRCRDKTSSMTRHLAQYPADRLDFSRVCPGFQETFLITDRDEMHK